VNVLVTGAGGPAGVAVIRALANAGHRVAAVDADPLAVGLRLAHEGFAVERCDDPRYAESLCTVARRTGSTVLVPTLAEEMPVLESEARLLDSTGLARWLPASEAVRLCIDKWAFACAMSAAAVPTPATALGSAQDVPGPWIVKPRFGRGSRDVFVADDPDALHEAQRRVPDPLVQHRVCGREFTVDTLVGRDGVLAAAVPRWRLETKSGISTKGRTFVDDAVVDVVARTLATVGLDGPANVQGFVDDGGGVTIVEMNPRFSGGLPLSLAAGADLVGEYVRGVIGLPLRSEHLQFRPGVTMIRHFDEVFEG
jgi:carbamoyl-phosphate synthase large subunit